MNLLNNISKLMINTYRIHPKYLTCNRDICLCISQLDLKIKQNYQNYNKCYESSKLFHRNELINFKFDTIYKQNKL